MCALNMPDLLSLLSFVILKWGFVGFYDRNWLPIDDDVS